MFMENFRKSFASFSESVVDIGANIQQNISPFAQRTKQQLHERIVGNSESTPLPQDYTNLEKQYEEILVANQDLLKVISVFEVEGNDYPPSFRDAINGTFKGLQSRVNLLRSATSAQDVGNILMKGPDSPHEPRTLNIALGGALTQLAETLTADNQQRIAPIYAAVGSVEEELGAAKLEQDRDITKYNIVLRDTVTEAQRAVQASRRQVTNARLDLDIKRSNMRHASPSAPNLGSLETEVDAAEEEFVAAIEEASVLMRHAIESISTKTVACAVQLARAQREFYRKSLQSLDALLPELEKKEAAARDFDTTEPSEPVAGTSQEVSISEDKEE